jgi:multimeric flavodoxin WrbA
MQQLLLIYGGHAGGRTAALTDAVRQGIDAARDEVELRALPAIAAGIDDLLWAKGLLIGSPEHFGYMAGAVKDFFDRTFYPAQQKTEALPYALFVSAGNDGTGAVGSIERIALGCRWRRVSEPLIVIGEPTPDALARCRDLGETFAVGLTLGLF